MTSHLRCGPLDTVLAQMWLNLQAIPDASHRIRRQITHPSPKMIFWVNII